jgi:hypothetical protein
MHVHYQDYLGQWRLWLSLLSNVRKTHATPWTNSLGQATHSIRYWDARIIRRSIRNSDDAVFNYFLLRYNVDRESFDTMMIITACIRQLTNSRIQLKDVLKDAKSKGLLYEVEVKTAIVERKYPHLTEDNLVYSIEIEEKIKMEIKALENRRNAQGSFRNLGRQI